MNRPIFARYEDPKKIDARLVETYQHACNLMPSVEDRVFVLHDYKGDLFVYWINKPTRYEKQVFEKAWDMVGEFIENVHHDWPSL